MVLDDNRTGATALGLQSRLRSEPRTGNAIFQGAVLRTIASDAEVKFEVELKLEALLRFSARATTRRHGRFLGGAASAQRRRRRKHKIGPAFDAFKLASIMIRLFIGFDDRKVHCGPTLRALWMWQSSLNRSGVVVLHLYAPNLYCLPFRARLSAT